MIENVHGVILRVDDLAAAVAFYRDVVGLEVAMTAGSSASLRAPGGPALLQLTSAGVEGPAPRRAAGLFHTAFRYPTRADLGSALRRVAANGASLTGASDHGVSEALYLRDPSDNGVELYWDRAREEWPEEMFSAQLDLPAIAAEAPGASPRAPEGTDVGHVHLSVSDLERAVGFWRGELGLDYKEGWDQAAFLAAGDYHHHVGLNTWNSLGAPIGPRRLAGLERVVLRATSPSEAVDPDGIAVELVTG